MDADYHAHSNYSDGRFLFSMAKAAEEAGLSAIGFADHCNVSEREPMIEQKRRLGFNLDATYERRRAAIEGLRERDWLTVDIYEAVEMDYHPDDEATIRAFLDDAGFDYAIGSVHHVHDVNVQATPYWRRKDDADRRAAVDRYFEHLVALAESELFEVAAHPDLIERNPVLRGYATDDHYRAVAEALADSRTVPEVNAGRVRKEYGHFHPGPDFREVLTDHGVGFTVGTDSHDPDEIGPRADELASLFADRDATPVDPR